MGWAQKMELYYLVPYGFPNISAGSLQIARMCQAFNEVGLKTYLIRPLSIKQNSVKEVFGFQEKFKIITIPGIYIGRRVPLLSELLFSLSLVIFSLWIFFLKDVTKIIIYGRNPNILPISIVIKLKKILGLKYPKIICEIHEGQLVACSRESKDLDGVIAITHFLKRYIEASGIPEEKIIVAPDGVHLDSYISLHYRTKTEIKKELGLPRDKKLVTFTGHLYADRGVEFLVDSMKYLDSDVLAIIVGGKIKDIIRIKKYIKKSGYESRVIITGHKPANEIPKYQVCSDVLVIPYTKKWKIKEWASPLKLFEYMAAKRPIVSTDFPSLREVLNESNAILVNPDSPEALANGIRVILQDPAFAKHIAQKAFSDVAIFTWQIRAAKILKFFQTLYICQ